MTYETYFVLPLNGFWDWSLAIPLVMLTFGIPLFYYRDRLREFNDRIYPTWFKIFKPLEDFVYSKRFAYFWIGGVILFGLMGFGAVYGEYFKARNALLTDNYSVVEGVVRDYRAGTNQKGSAYDNFCVKGICFVVSDWEVTGGFHQMQINGSPLKNDLPVRISYIGDTIVRVEIATNAGI